MKKLLALTVIALLSVSGLNFGQMMNGQNNGKQGGMNYGMPGARAKQMLNLSDEQAKKFDEIMFAQKESAIDTKAEVQKLKLEIQKITNSGNIDVNKIKKLNAKIQELRTKQQNSRLETWAKVNKILTPEQKKQWSKMLNKMINRKGFGKRGRRGMHGKGMMNRNGMPMRGGMMK